MFSEDDTLIEINKKFNSSCKANVQKKMPLLCNVSENEINLNSNEVADKRKWIRGRWLEYHGSLLHTGFLIDKAYRKFDCLRVDE